MLQNKLNSDVRVLPPMFKPVLQKIWLLTGLNVDCKTRNIAPGTLCFQNGGSLAETQPVLRFPLSRKLSGLKRSFILWEKEAVKVLVNTSLPPFSLIRDFRKQNTRGNVSKISVNHACYRQIGSKSTNHSPLAWRKVGQKVTLVVVIGGFRSDLSITCMIDGNFGNVSAGILFSKVAYQRKRW